MYSHVTGVRILNIKPMASHDEGGIAVADSRGALLQPIICGSGAPRYVLCMLPSLDLL